MYSTSWWNTIYSSHGWKKLEGTLVVIHDGVTMPFSGVTLDLHQSQHLQSRQKDIRPDPQTVHIRIAPLSPGTQPSLPECSVRLVNSWCSFSQQTNLKVEASSQGGSWPLQVGNPFLFKCRSDSQRPCSSYWLQTEISWCCVPLKIIRSERSSGNWHVFGYEPVSGVLFSREVWNFTNQNIRTSFIQLLFFLSSRSMRMWNGS